MVEEHKKKLHKHTATTLRFLINERETKGCLAQLNSNTPKKTKNETAIDNSVMISGSFQACVLPPNETPVTNETLAVNKNPAPIKSIRSSFSFKLSVGLLPFTRL